MFNAEKMQIQEILNKTSMDELPCEEVLEIYGYFKEKYKSELGGTVGVYLLGALRKEKAVDG